MIDWDNVLIEASMAVMQGIQESGKLGIAAEIVPEKLAEQSVRVAKCLVAELKRNLDGK